MKLDELRAELAPRAAELSHLANVAELDDFAPWVVRCLRRAAFLAALGDQALRESQNQLEYEEAHPPTSPAVTR